MKTTDKMLKFLILITVTVVAGKQLEDIIANQLVDFKKNLKGPAGVLSTSNGAPVESVNGGSTLNTNLLDNEFFIETLGHFNRERAPVRGVHPKGAGAFGYFITTRDMSHVTRAEFLNGVGKVTPVAFRGSMGATERGGSDLTREPRGFSVKFYTEEGNFDIPGFNTPIFTYKDPRHFVDFAHVMRKNPLSDLIDPNMTWDFITNVPSSVFIFLVVFGDIGIPYGYACMEGHNLHTLPLYNKKGNITYARFHFYNNKCGHKFINSTEALRISALDPDFSARHLYNSIASGDYPTWDVSVQLMSQDYVDNASYDVFDVSKLIPESEIPYTKIGKLVLNRNPKNYFADVEQLSFCPGNLVPGILPSPDKSFQARHLFYEDAARYRLGPNYNRIPVNYPYRSKYHNNYLRDGVSPVGDNGMDGPSYYVNSFGGPVSYKDVKKPKVPEIHEADPDNFGQARDYYLNVIRSEERDRVADNVVFTLCSATKFLQDKAVKLFSKVHPDLGQRVAKALKKC